MAVANRFSIDLANEKPWQNAWKPRSGAILNRLLRVLWSNQDRAPGMRRQSVRDAAEQSAT